MTWPRFVRGHPEVLRRNGRTDPITSDGLQPKSDGLEPTSDAENRVCCHGLDGASRSAEELPPAESRTAAWPRFGKRRFGGWSGEGKRCRSQATTLITVGGSFDRHILN